MTDAIVVGGGMVGAAAALALAHAGMDVVLVEAREPRPWQAEDEVDLRVVALAPSSASLLDELGLWQTIRTARAHAYTRMHVWDAESGAALDFDSADVQGDSLGWIVENRLLQYRLWQKAQAAGVRRLCPAKVNAFENLDDHVHVSLEDGTGLDAKVLVAADGATSPLREWAGITTRGHAYGQRAVVAHVATERSHEDTAWQRFLQGGPIALLPLTDGRSSVVWTLPESEAQRVLSMDDAAFCEAVGVASDFRLGRVTATTPRAAFPLKLQLASEYRSGRLVLLGDAAHVVHPLAGQGVNLGLRDVAELRDVLRNAHDAGRDVGADHVLQRYARRRRSADTLDGRAFDALQRMFAWRTPAMASVRSLGMTAMNRFGPVKKRLMQHAAGI
ncbi:MAG TPA: UbiH/UbiF/VisC/COQ6 family ubiquinone biosynthesis hydroxylase [Rhodanobacteraceae bacterium]|nr:UbiH/UbiF/VisC/COQ6 family ubiquinone biosynthesis hydroxylase [Rhodanobacteraceae bacterium]